MKIKPEFEINGLVFSKLLKKMYSWNELEQRGFRFIDKHSVEWRVPTIAELITLFDAYEQTHTNSMLWSSSPDAVSSGNAWLVNFYNGYADSYYRSYERQVRLVRDKAVSLDIPEFVVLSRED